MHNGRLPEEFGTRTKPFASATIRLFAQLPKPREEVKALGKQRVRSGTSVAAQVRAASRARPDDALVSKLGGALPETDGSELWLELLRDDCGNGHFAAGKRGDGLLAIFTTMINKTKRGKAEINFCFANFCFYEQSSSAFRFVNLFLL